LFDPMTSKSDSRLATEVIASPNHDARTARVDILLLHYTGMTTEEEALARLTDPEAKVSSHYFVYEDGRICQLVPEARRAWHAGLSSWRGATDINARSIGIEIANPGHEFGYREFPQPQIDAVIGLCRDIVARHGIRRERVLAHSDVAPARKQDPGEKFPWDRLASAGVGLWVEPAPIAAGRTFSANDRGLEVEDLQRQLARFGYATEISRRYDDNTRSIVTAFQRHFRPERVDGLADVSTRETLARLLKK
jgi:N-acetylmuramoyl-L-alanine amidase